MEMTDKKSLCIITESKINLVPVLFVENNEVRVKRVVFLFHKLLNNKLNELPLAYILANSGYFVVILDMWGHGERAGSYDITGKYEFNNLFRDIYNTANDLHIIIDYLKKNKSAGLDFNNMSAVGASVGGSIALVVGYLVHEIKYIVSIISTCHWEYMLNNKTFESFRFHAYSNPVMDYEQLREYVNEHNPLNNYNRQSVKPILFLNGMLDTTVPITIAVEYFNHLKNIFSAYGKGEYLELKTYSHAGHEVTFEMIRDLFKWLGGINK